MSIYSLHSITPHPKFLHFYKPPTSSPKPLATYNKTITIYGCNIILRTSYHQINNIMNNYDNPYVQNSPAPPPTTTVNTLNTIGHKVESATKKAENLLENIYTHYRTGPGLLDVTKSRFNQTARFLFEPGFDNGFKREFGVSHGEQLKKSYACYLSIPGGPVLGTMYISNKRVCFKSDSPVWTGPCDGPGRWVYYKVVIELFRVETVNSSLNRAGEKYIEIVTKDGHEFWFMGFVFYENALKHLYDASLQ